MALRFLKGVKIDKTFAKWGNIDEKLLNVVYGVNNVKLRGKTGIYSNRK
jgi:hypothetical protein